MPRKQRGGSHSVRTEEAFGKPLGLRELEDPLYQPAGMFQALLNAETQLEVIEKRLGWPHGVESPIEGQPGIRYLKQFIDSEKQIPAQLLVGTDDGKIHAIPSIFKNEPHLNEVNDRLTEVNLPIIDPFPDPDAPLTADQLDTFRTAIEDIVGEGKFTPRDSSTPYATVADLLTDAIGQATYTNPSPLSAVAPIDIKEITYAIMQLSYRNVAIIAATTIKSPRKRATSADWATAWLATVAAAPVDSGENGHTESEGSTDGVTNQGTIARTAFEIDTTTLPANTRFLIDAITIEATSGAVRNHAAGVETGESIRLQFYATDDGDVNDPAVYSDVDHFIGALDFTSPSGAQTQTGKFGGSFAFISRTVPTVFLMRILNDELIPSPPPAPAPPAPSDGSTDRDTGFSSFSLQFHLVFRSQSLPNYNVAVISP